VLMEAPSLTPLERKGPLVAHPAKVASVNTDCTILTTMDTS